MCSVFGCRVCGNSLSRKQKGEERARPSAIYLNSPERTQAQITTGKIRCDDAFRSAHTVTYAADMRDSIRIHSALCIPRVCLVYSVTHTYTYASDHAQRAHTFKAFNRLIISKWTTEVPANRKPITLFSSRRLSADRAVVPLLFHRTLIIFLT